MKWWAKPNLPHLDCEQLLGSGNFHVADTNPLRKRFVLPLLVCGLNGKRLLSHVLSLEPGICEVGVQSADCAFQNEEQRFDARRGHVPVPCGATRGVRLWHIFSLPQPVRHALHHLWDHGRSSRVHCGHEQTGPGRVWYVSPFLTDIYKCHTNTHTHTHTYSCIEKK